MTSEIWIAEDDRSLRWVMEKAISRDGIDVKSFETGEQLLAALNRGKPEIIISDIRMPGIDGLTLLKRIHADQPDIPIIITTAHSDLDSAVAAYQGGAFEYLPKPFDIASAVELISRVMGEHRKSDGKESSTQASMGNLLGTAPKMQEIYRVIGRLSNSATTVLVNGETGTGRE